MLGFRHVFAVSVVTALACSHDTSPTTPDPSNPGGAVAQKGCAQTSVGFSPLDNTKGSYQGQAGGLYPGSQNPPPSNHLAAGVQLARAIGPLDSSGHASSSGRYGFISIGMSNTTQEFSTFVPMANSDSLKDPHLVVMDGAQGGVTAADWINPGC